MQNLKKENVSERPPSFDTPTRRKDMAPQNVKHLCPHLQYHEKSTEEPYHLDIGWKEWIAYPFTIFSRGEPPGTTKIPRSIQLTHEFMATICEVWIEAGLLTRSFVLQGMASLKKCGYAMETWLEPRHGRMYGMKKKME